MTRAVPNTFANVTNATTPNLDADFSALAPGVVLACTATGTNTILLTPVASTLSVTGYSDKEIYSFVAAANSTGSVQINISGVGAVNLYLADGVTQAGSGNIALGKFYMIAYQTALSGFVIVSAASSSTPTRQVFTSSSGTYTTPIGTTWLEVRLIGAGGGAGAAITNNGADGGDTTFSALTGSGGKAGAANGGPGGNGGAATGGNINIPGGNGSAGANPGISVNLVFGIGGNGVFGGGAGGPQNGNAGVNGATNSGGGGSGGSAAGANGGAGGGAGGYCETIITAPATTYSYVVGSGGVGGAAGTMAGGSGAAGIIIVTEYYS